MDVVIRVDEGSTSDAERELRSLFDWLLADASSRRHARPALTASAASVSGAQGGAIEVLSLVLGTAFNTASLAFAIASWRRTRPQQPTLVIESSGGARVTLTGGTDEDVRSVLAQLQQEQA